MSDKAPPSLPTNPKPSIVLTILTAVALGTACLISFAREMRRSADIVPALGAGMSPVLVCLIVVAVCSIGRKFRTVRSQTKIVLWTSIVQVLLALFDAVQRIPP